MPEPIVLDKLTQNGLRPKAIESRNSQFAVQFDGLIPTEYGAKAIPQPTYPVNSSGPAQADFSSDGWPFPHVERADRKLLLFGKTTAYSLAETWSSGLASTALTPQLPSVEKVSDGTFTAGTPWTTDTGWAIAGGVLTGTTASTSVSQAFASQANGGMAAGYKYLVTYTITRSAGTVQILLGAGGGTVRSAAGTYSEWITAVNTNPILYITGVGFSGTVDNISIKAIANIAPTYQTTITGKTFNKWHVAGFGNNWFATNSQDLLYYTSSVIGSNPVLVSSYGATPTAPAINTLCAHDNRLVLGGINISVFAQKPIFIEAFDAWKRSRGIDHVMIDEDETLTQDWIVWSEQGGGDRDIPFTNLLAMFDIPSEYDGTTASNGVIAAKFRSAIIAAIEQHKMGFLPLRLAKEVRCLKVLGNDIIAYGTRSISRLRWTEVGYVEDVLTQEGITSRDAVCGDEAEHLYVGTNNHIFRRKSDGALEDIDRSEFIDSLTLAKVVGAFNPIERYFSFADGTNAFTVTRTGGVAKTSAELYTSLLTTPGYEGLIGVTTTAAAPYAVTIETETFDGGYRQLWELFKAGISTTDTDATGWQVKAKWRKTKAESFTTPSSYVTVDERGLATLKQAGIEFRLLFYAADRRYVDLERIEIYPGEGSNFSMRSWLNA